MFIPGSEWVYFKIYTGTKTADTILKNELFNYVSELLSNEVIDKWFFIRYADPDFHIRLRLHLKETKNFSFVYSRFFETFTPIVDNGFVWKIQCDTYQREIERYGANTISLVEDLFFMDSEYIVRLLYQLDNQNHEQQRWQMALVLIDSFLSAFSFDLQKRKELLTSMADNFKKEFGFTHHTQTKQLNDKYRFFRKDIENAMAWEKVVSQAIDIIKTRSKAILPVAEELSNMEKSGNLQVTTSSLLSSLIHITMNRWFRTKNRLHEMVIYEFLSRYYTGEMAKDKYNPQKINA